MAKILSEYGPERGQGERASNGGCCEPKPLPYSPPVGPVVPMQQGPGLGGTNHGNTGTQGRH